MSCLDGLKGHSFRISQLANRNLLVPRKIFMSKSLEPKPGGLWISGRALCAWAQPPQACPWAERGGRKYSVSRVLPSIAV